MDITKNKRNDLMGRKEVSVILESDKNPGFAEAAKILADNFKASEENIMVENVKGKFGAKTFLIKACIYDTKELKDAALKLLTKPKKVAVAS